MTQITARAVRFDHYGGLEVLYLTDIPMPVPAAGEVLVEVRAAGINPGETNIRTGLLQERFPATFPSGQGSDLAGIVAAIGDGVTDFSVGDEVLGYSWRRSSHATHVAVPTSQLIRKPPQLVAVSAAAGGVGSVVVQLLASKGVRVLGIASAANDNWLIAHGATPVHYGDDLAARLTAEAPDGIAAFIDLFGADYLTLAVQLGIPRDRIETITAFDAARELGTRAEGSAAASTKEVLSEMADLVAAGIIEIPIAATYPLDQVSDAFAQLERRHTHGKIVLIGDA
jgi:NADPH2:quinone reductase